MKKVLSTIGLAVVLAGSTFANGGIIVAGKSQTINTGCTSRDGIIVAGRDGIIVAGKDIVGIIVAGLTGITVVGDADGCTSTERDGIIITD